MTDMAERAQTALRRYREIESKLSDPAVSADHEQVRRLAMERASLQRAAEAAEIYIRLAEETEGLRAMTSERDPELARLAKGELEEKRPALEEAERQLGESLAQRDPDDHRDVVVEIRAGTGGNEAGIFAGDLLAAYLKYAKSRGWLTDVIETSSKKGAGMSRVVFQVKGDRVYSRLKHEAGVHRVQRVPETEAQGRVHTSTATVAVFPEPGQVEFEVREADLRIDTFHASGKGGQSVNKLETAVRIVHVPSGTTVSIQDERSQQANRERAMTVLRAKLWDAQQKEQERILNQSRKEQVGAGDRAEKIRTYNYPQDRVTNHLTGTSVFGIERLMNGNLDDVLR